jgi:hypothetical protein
MDAIDLLGVLDVIRNEKLYNERLQKIAEATEKLKESQLIADTLEMAHRRVEEAKQLRQEAAQEAQEIVDKAEVDVAKRSAVLAEKEQEVAKREQDFESRRIEIEARFTKARAMQKEAIAKENACKDLEVKLQEQLVEVNKLKQYYFEKVEAFKLVIGS